MEEHVLAVPRARLLPEGEPLGLGFASGDPDRWLRRIAESCEFLPRRRAEEDEGWKQIIPYGVVVSGTDVFLLRRRGGGERRLQDKRSIGVGGHVDRQDVPDSATPPRDPAAVESLLARAFRRELHEELVLSPPRAIEWAGVINDDTTPVGRVHFGWVLRVDVECRDVAVREVDRLEGAFVDRSTLASEWERLESWSQMAAAALLDVSTPTSGARPAEERNG